MAPLLGVREKIYAIHWLRKLLREEKFAKGRTTNTALDKSTLHFLRRIRTGMTSSYETNLSKTNVTTS